MAQQDDLIRIVMDVVNTEKIAEAQKAIEKEEQAIRDLAAALKAGTIGQAEFDAASLKNAASIKQNTAAIKAAGGAFNPRSLLEFSRAAEDAQFGIAGVVNNIPGLVQSLGGSTGVVGVASLAAIGIAQLVKNWDSLASAFGQGHVKTQAEELKELAEATSLTADQAERLARATAPAAKVKELQGGQTEADAARDSAVTKAIVEAGTSDVVRGVLAVAPELVDSQGDAAIAADAVAKARESLESARAAAGQSEDVNAIPEAERKLREATEKLTEARKTTAATITSTSALAKLFPGGLAQLRGLVESNPDKFGPKGNQLRKDLAEANQTPDEQEQEKAQAHLDATLREHENKLAQLQVEGMNADEAEQEVAQKHLDQTLDAGSIKLADWQAQQQAKLDEEDQGAMVADELARRQQARADLGRGAQVFDNFASFRDSIQQAASKDGAAERTAVDQLAEMREVKALTKRQVELSQTIANRIGGPARAG